MLAADELNVKSEEAVWECALRWVNHDPENRKHHIVTLMKSIRLGLLDTQFFLENVSTIGNARPVSGMLVGKPSRKPFPSSCRSRTTLT